MNFKKKGISIFASSPKLESMKKGASHNADL
jgi:hypothetical protein